MTKQRYISNQTTSYFILGAGSSIDLYGSSSFKKLKPINNNINCYWQNVGNYFSKSIQNTQKSSIKNPENHDKNTQAN